MLEMFWINFSQSLFFFVDPVRAACKVDKQDDLQQTENEINLKLIHCWNCKGV